MSETSEQGSDIRICAVGDEVTLRGRQGTGAFHFFAPASPARAEGEAGRLRNGWRQE